MEKGPEIGSAEAAVRSCVSLMAAVTGQREEILAYWLDLYWQVRSAYERETAPEEDPTVLRKADLYPVIREMMQDAIRSVVRSEAKERLEKREKPKQSEEDPAPADGAPKLSHWAKTKQDVLARLTEARKQGATFAQIIEAADGSVTERELVRVLNAERVPFETYKRIEAALGALGY